MTGRERIRAALSGKEVDRPPLNLGGTFLLHEKELPQDEMQWGWMKEKRFLELREYLRPWCDCYCGFEPPLFNRYMMVSANRITTDVVHQDNNHRIIRGTIHLPDGDVFYEDHQKRGFATDWHITVPGDNPAVLERMLNAPFEVDETAVRKSVSMLKELDEKLGDNGYPNIFLPSPAVAISHGMHLEEFLTLCFEEEDLVLSFCEEITKRISLCLDALFREGIPECSVTFGGSEQFTPPMMRPDSFDTFVVPFEGPLVKKIKAHGNLVECHCHGKVAYALRKMAEMGYDATNPIEPPPQGDVTFAQAREIVGDQVTLVGNFELVELEREPAYIAKRVDELLSLGTRRLILTDAGGLRQAVTAQMDANYRAWVDAYAKHFR